MRINDSFMVREVLDSYQLFISVKYREHGEELVKENAFAYWKMVSDLPVNRMFLRDPQQTHFHYGIPDVAENLYELADYIVDYIRSRKIRRVLLLGASAGGYGALVLGKLIALQRPDLPIDTHSYDPQTKLRYYIQGEKVPPENAPVPFEFGYIKEPSPTPELMDLHSYFLKHPPESDFERYRVIFGTDAEDRYYMEELHPLLDHPGYRPGWGRSRMIIRNIKSRDCVHGSEIVRLSQEGKLRKIVFKSFGYKG